MYDIQEQVLIVYSVAGTQGTDLTEARNAIENYSHPASNLRMSPRVFEIPAGAGAGTTLGAELTRELRTSLGAVVFADDLRPNVVYELGFFHGRGTRVLLLTRNPIDSFWLAISDLAGCVLAQLNSTNIDAAISSYLTRLYEDAGRAPSWRLISSPTSTTNLLAQITSLTTLPQFRTAGPAGPYLEIDTWDHLDIPLQFSLLSEARFHVLVRATGPDAECTIYFNVRLPDRQGERRQVWLGLTSTKRTAYIRREERTIPMQAPTSDWCLLTGSFNELLRSGAMLGSGPVDYVDRVRFRAGRSGESGRVVVPVEIGYLSISGRDT
jgi:hypothetical protein